MVADFPIVPRSVFFLLQGIFKFGSMAMKLEAGSGMLNWKTNLFSLFLVFATASCGEGTRFSGGNNKDERGTGQSGTDTWAHSDSKGQDGGTNTERTSKTQQGPGGNSILNDSSAAKGAGIGTDGKAPYDGDDARDSITALTGDQFVQTFSLKKSTLPLRIVWVLDNSGSMTQERDHVARNMSGFLQHLQNKAKTQLALISAMKSPGRRSSNSVFIGRQAVYLGGANFSLQSEHLGAGHVQVPWRVSSHNSLQLASEALGSVTGNTYSEATFGSFPGREAVQNSPLKGFFEKNTQNVLVVVTDDDARRFGADEFLSPWQGYKDSPNFRFFGFIGLNEGRQSRDCKIANAGEEYQKLALKTGGQVFDICEPDWSANFGVLADQILKLAFSAFKLTYSASSIDRVWLDGKPLAKSDYRLRNGNLQIKPASIDPLRNKSVKVRYQAKRG